MSREGLRETYSLYQSNNAKKRKYNTRILIEFMNRFDGDSMGFDPIVCKIQLFPPWKSFIFVKKLIF